jgi:trans-4-hydroxy-L-proline dehydratase
MSAQPAERIQSKIKEPKGLSQRITRLRDYYFKGMDRIWNNESTSWTTGTPWDVQFNEMTFYIVPETYMLMQTLRSSYRQAARSVKLPENFWSKPIVERRAWFIREVMINYLPKEVLPGDLIAGGRFNIQASMCLTENEQAEFDSLTMGKDGARTAMKWFHDHGYGNSGATSGHLIPDHQRTLELGWKGIHAELESFYTKLSEDEKKGARGAQLRAMMTAATMPKDLANKYANLCRKLADGEKDAARKAELLEMTKILKKVPWEPAETFPARGFPSAVSINTFILTGKIL